MTKVETLAGEGNPCAHAFERALRVHVEDSEFTFGIRTLAWADFLLNPRR